MAPKKKITSKETFLWTEIQLEADMPLITKRDDSDENIPKIKQTRTPSLYNKMLGSFMKQVSQENNNLSQRDRMLRAQSLYRSWKAQQN